MSLLYSIMKPIVRHKKKGRVHQAQTWEAFAQRGREMQAKFRFELPKIKGFEFRDEQIDGYHCIIGRKAGAKPTRALMYFFGGDEIFAGEAPAYEAAFRRCGVKDAVVHVEPGLFHGYPMFTFVKEGKLGEDYVIGYLKA